MYIRGFLFVFLNFRVRDLHIFLDLDLFSSHVWEVRMSPRLLRFLLVYVLVGLTFTALASGATERVLRAHFDGGPGTVFISRFPAVAFSVGEGGMLLPGLQGNPHGVEEVGGLGASIIGGSLRIGFQTFFQKWIIFKTLTFCTQQ